MTFTVTTTHPLADPQTRTYHCFSDMATDAVSVRIYHGIHFRFADEEARKQGRHVAQWTFGHFLRRQDAEFGVSKIPGAKNDPLVLWSKPLAPSPDDPWDKP